MKSYIKSILFAFLILPQLLYCQKHFIKIIDFDSLSQSCQQVIHYGDNFLLGYYQTCNDLQSQCSGIIKIDHSGKIIDKVILEKFSNNPNSMLLDKDDLYLTGEIYNWNVDAHEYLIHTIDSGNFDSLSTHQIFNSAQPYVKMFQLANAKWNDKYAIAGNGRIIENSPNLGVLYILNNDFTLDTLIEFNFFRGNITPWEMYVDKENRLTLHLITYNFDTAETYAFILKFDTDYNLVWQWKSEELRTDRGLPFGFQHVNGNSIINLSSEGFGAINEVRAIKPDSSILWRMKWQGPFNGQARYIDRLRQAKNGDIIGVGRYSDFLNTSPPFASVPLIFRLSPNGQLFWFKVYYKHQFYLNDDDVMSGGFSDVIETDNGDLIAVGRIHNQLLFDPKVNGSRNDWDILLARLGPDGCIEPGCGEINKIDFMTGTEDIESSLNTSLILCYPNPLKDQELVIDFPEYKANRKYTVHIISIDGKTHYRNSLLSDKSIIQLTQSGLYIISVLEEGKTIFRDKLIKL